MHTAARVAHVRDALLELPELCALLPESLTRGPSPQGGRGPAAFPRAPLSLDVLQLLDVRDRTSWLDGMEYCDPDSVGILPYLWGWCRDLEATALDEGHTLPGGDVPAKPTVANLCDWLTQALDYATGLPQWPEFAWGVETCWRRATAAVKAAHTSPVPCPRCTTGRLVRPGDAALWECGQCGHVVTVQAVTLRQAAPLVGVPLRTLYRWDAQRMITAVKDEQGRRWWDLGDIRRAAAQTRLAQLGLAPH